MRTLLILLVLAAIGGYVAFRHLPTGTAQANKPETPSQQIQSISIDGGRGLPLAALRAVLVSKPGEQVDDAKLEADRIALGAELASRGYLAALVRPAVVTYSTGAYVVYEIDAGDVFKIRDVKVIGASEKDAVITISKGDEALASRIESARQILAENLERHGKKHTVTVSIERDIANHVVDVTLTTK